jgi:hypothetical protein
MHITQAHRVKTRAYDNPATNNKTEHTVQRFDQPIRGSRSTSKEFSLSRAFSIKKKTNGGELCLGTRGVSTTIMRRREAASRNPAAGPCAATLTTQINK